MKKLKKHTLRAERNMVCALCAAVFLVFAGAALAGWLAAPFPVGAVLTGVAAFVLLFTGILSGSWVKYAKRYYAAATSPDYPTAIIGEGLTVTFCAVSPEKAAAYLREGAALPPLPERYTREQWSERSDAAKDIKARTLGDAQTVSYPAVCPADLAALQNKKCVLLRKTYAENRAVFDYCGVFAAQQPLIADE